MLKTAEIPIEKIPTSRLSEVDFNNLQFGRLFSDHMFLAEFRDGQWQDLRIVPYGNLSLSPATMALHYAQSIFEGMKAYLTPKKEVVTFRPQENLARLNHSAQRMCMPEIPEEIFMEGLKQLLTLDKNWVPQKEGSSLYIRPLMFASDAYIGLQASENYLFMLITAPVGAYYANPVKVKIETDFVRAAQGGVGAAKTAGNYAASLYPASLGQAEGFDQLVWTDSKEHKYIEESGTMNLFFKFDDTLVTPSLVGTILPGITRKSILKIAEEQGIKTEERLVSVDEVISSIENGSLKEVFGAGTAAIITPVRSMGYEDKIYELPPIREEGFALKTKKMLLDLQTGKIEDPHNWVYKICDL